MASSSSAAPVLRSPANGVLSPIAIGSALLQNRIVLAPLTRARTDASRLPNDLMLEYYVQRASGGMIITEATAISEQGFGWRNAPGIYTAEQAEGWKKIVDAVHAKGGKICLQLWHMGRQSHSSHQPGGQQIVSASAIACPGDVTTASGEKSPYEVPRPLETEEIAGVVQDYKKAAQFCKDAGFDFVEIHGANGYLIDQFLQSCTNKRTDRYGGSFENRFRILDEVVTAIKEVYPSEAIGVRLAPNGGFAGMGSEDNAAAFVYYAAELAKHNLGFLHVMDGVGFGQHSFKLLTLSDIRKVYDGVIMANVGYTKETADGVIRSGAADMVAFGRLYMSNPDLPERFAKNLPLNELPPYPTWWTSDLGAEGYTSWEVHPENKQ